jgi:hypothetical protein
MEFGADVFEILAGADRRQKLLSDCLANAPADFLRRCSYGHRRRLTLDQMRVDLKRELKIWRHFTEEKNVEQTDVGLIAIDVLQQCRGVDLRADSCYTENSEPPRITGVIYVILNKNIQHS